MSFLRSAAAQAVLGVGVVKDDADLKAPVERVVLEGQEVHVDRLSRYAPGVSDDDGNPGHFVSNKAPTPDQHWASGL